MVVYSKRMFKGIFLLLMIYPLHALDCGGPTEINPFESCQCGSVACNINQYCNAEFSICSDQSNPSCLNTGILTPNMDSCLCVDEICSPDSYCSPDSATKCHNQFCSDYSDIDLLCQRTVLEGQTQTLYSNGVKDGNPQCAGTTCQNSDFETCCKICDGIDFGVSNGKCSKKCDINCNGTYIQPTNITSQQREANPLYTGFCDGLTCSESDKDLCCFKAPSCLDGNIFRAGEVCNNATIYSGNVLNNTCQTVDCSNDVERCCEKVNCKCLNGTGVGGIYCPSPETYKCASCNSDFWLNGDVCQYSTQCQTNEYEYRPLQVAQDRICLPLTNCSQGQFIQTPTNGTVDRVCKDWQVCDFIYQYDNSAVGVPNLNSDRDCRNITICNATEYETQAPTTTSDRQCVPLSPECSSNFYESTIPNATTDRICSPVAPPCSNFEYESQSPSKTQNRICLPLQNCNSAQFILQEATSTSNRICKNKTICNANEWELFEGNQTSDRECMPLTGCRSIEYEKNPMTYYTRDRICLLLSVCNKTQYVSVPATSSSDRVCTQCNFEGCVGCTIQEDCAFSSIAKALDPDSCSQHVCTTIYYNKNSSGVTFNPETFTLRDDEWFRFENTSQHKIVFSGVNITDTSDYQYFYVPSNLETDITYDNIVLPVLQDCEYEFMFSLCANASSAVPGCGPGTETGFRGSKIKDARHGGLACSTIPETITRSCIGTRCPKDCIYEWSQWSQCSAPCGEPGQKSRYVIVLNKTEHGGLACPSNQTENCITEPDDNGQPGDQCDCEGHVRDVCGHCGGNGRICLGCDGVPYSGKTYDQCGRCGGDGTSCISRMKLHAKQKEHTSRTLAIGLPVGGATIFVIIIAAMLAYFCNLT